MHRIMKRLLFLSTLLASLTLCAACSDDDDLSLEMTAADLEQTTWNAHKIAYDGQGDIVNELFYILEFQTDETGKLTEMNADGEYLRTSNFYYTVDRKLIQFQGALTLNWTVTERTKHKIVMQTFLENKFVMTLTRMY